MELGHRKRWGWAQDIVAKVQLRGPVVTLSSRAQAHPKNEEIISTDWFSISNPTVITQNNLCLTRKKGDEVTLADWDGVDVPVTARLSCHHQRMRCCI